MKLFIYQNKLTKPLDSLIFLSLNSNLKIALD